MRQVIEMESEVILRIISLYVRGGPQVDFQQYPLGGREFTELIARHRLTNVFARLMTNGVALPPRSASPAIDRVMKQNLVNQAYLQTRQRELEAELARLKIPAKILKGRVLGELCYQRVSDRPSNDIDVMVPPDSLEDVWDCLLSKGYRVVSPKIESRWHQKLYQRYISPKYLLNREEYGRAYGRQALEKDGVEVDLHWTPRYQPRDLDRNSYIELNLPHYRISTEADEAEEVRFQTMVVLAHCCESYRPQAIQLLDLALLISKFNLQIEQLVNHSEIRFSGVSQQQFEHLFLWCQGIAEGNESGQLEANKQRQCFFFHRGLVDERFSRLTLSEKFKDFFSFLFFIPWHSKLLFIVGACLPEPRENQQYPSRVVSFWWSRLRKESLS